MHLLAEIAATQPAFQNHLGTLRAQAPLHGKVTSRPFTYGNEKRLFSAWRFLDITKNLNFNKWHHEMPSCRLVIKAVATLEPTSVVKNEDAHSGHNNSKLGVDASLPKAQLKTFDENSTELDEREKLRRMRISKANKGNTPWNKGRKHSPETLQRIREGTRLAMQNPKVKMKLVNLGHAQTEETRIKIGVGVRMGWERRRQKLLVQETCHFEWQNLIAEASRQGSVDEEELQWDSYKILDEQLKREWLESVELRKTMPRPKGSKRAPKSLEQRRKIAEAISRKWSDPEYRERVCSALAKYHGTPAGTERKPRRRPTSEAQSTRRSPAKKKVVAEYSSPKTETKIQNQREKLRKRNAPLYKDPLASSKLEMIKNIRAQRAAVETKKSETIERARLLIAEAEKAAKALEVAATKSPIAQASLMETRMLIAEAVQSIESIESGLISSQENGKYPLPSPTPTPTSNEMDGQADMEIDGRKPVLDKADDKKVNGNHSLASSKEEDFDLGKFTLQHIPSGEDEFLPVSSSDYALSPFIFESLIKQSDSGDEPNKVELNKHGEEEKVPPINGSKVETPEEDRPSNLVTVTKKWVCGRLVEVAEGA
ncbi:uncharacterized protein LOC107434437 isoform X1 [Ziziphus jujuba]|uniref:Uncharacterized protein LOC107434437 isoform X1 n=2 Tax=Ziziphus jujuba TaxID=326968 RepID=A0A6P4BEQ4_ZIZJJ|nr:uncharacterized protein LOC107434437 isoform X1 [Ziziphus jujuba]